MMVMGNLIENVNKRSEAANRKYRAFIHFLKNEKKSMSTKKGEVKDTTNKATPKADGPVEESHHTNADGGKMQHVDELSASDADDDFDDRYIHLSKLLIISLNFNFSCGSFRN